MHLGKSLYIRFYASQLYTQIESIVCDIIICIILSYTMVDTQHIPVTMHPQKTKIYVHISPRTELVHKVHSHTQHTHTCLYNIYYTHATMTLYICNQYNIILYHTISNYINMIDLIYQLCVNQQHTCILIMPNNR